MKTLIFLFVAASAMMTTTIQLSSSAEQEIKAHVADAYSVTENDITLQSPNLVLVDLGLNNVQGTATFTPTGTGSTKVEIDFPGLRLELIVEDEVQGF